MAGSLNFSKISKTIKIFAVAQVALVLMLGYMAFLFQAKIQATGSPQAFMYGVLISFAIQLILFYPIYKFSGAEAERDVTIATANLSEAEFKALGKKKRMSDIIKGSIFFFFAMFILQAPNPSGKAGGASVAATLLFLSVIYYTFILTILSYFQCYNFAAKKQMRTRS